MTEQPPQDPFQPQGPPPGVPSGPPPGWYPDPDGQPVQRWWSGMGWTPHTQPMAGSAPGPQPPHPGEQYGTVPPSGHRARKSWPARHKVLTGIIAVVVLIIIGSIAGGASGIHKTSSGAAAGAPAGPASSGPASAPAASPSSSGSLSGPAGTTYSVTGDNGPNGATTTYTVTMNRSTQHATLGQYETLTNGSDHVTAAEFTIAGKSGQSSDDADSDAVAVGTDGQDYTAAFDTITEGTNFNDGQFQVGPGESVTGWVSFELPAGVSIASVQWSPGNSEAATWTVGS
jgi:Protein of unknown function (DUF2510)